MASKVEDLQVDQRGQVLDASVCEVLLPAMAERPDVQLGQACNSKRASLRTPLNALQTPAYC